MQWWNDDWFLGEIRKDQHKLKGHKTENIPLTEHSENVSSYILEINSDALIFLAAYNIISSYFGLVGVVNGLKFLLIF